MNITSGYFNLTDETSSSTSGPPLISTDNSTETFDVTNQEPQEEFWEYTAAKYLFAVPSPILLLFGSLGNILSFLVFSTPKMRKSVTSVYFRGLAVSDTIVVLFGATVGFILGSFDIDIRLISKVSCKIWDSVVMVSCYHSCWILVFIAVDRFIGISLPHKYKVLCTKRRAHKSMMVLLILILSTVGVFWFLSLELTVSPDGKTCGVSQNYQWFFTNAFIWLDLGVLNLIPTIILVILNVYIIVTVAKAADKRKITTGDNSKNAHINTPTFILLSVSLVYILCTIPSSTAPFVVRAFGTRPHGKAQTQLYNRFCFMLYLANHAVNFLLYCVHGSQFKSELCRLFSKASSQRMVDSTMMSTQKSVVSRTDSNMSDVCVQEERSSGGELFNRSG